MIHYLTRKAHFSLTDFVKGSTNKTIFKIPFEDERFYITFTIDGTDECSFIALHDSCRLPFNINFGRRNDLLFKIVEDRLGIGKKEFTIRSIGYYNNGDWPYCNSIFDLHTLYINLHTALSRREIDFEIPEIKKTKTILL